MDSSLVNLKKINNHKPFNKSPKITIPLDLHFTSFWKYFTRKKYKIKLRVGLAKLLLSRDLGVSIILWTKVHIHLVTFNAIVYPY